MKILFTFENALPSTEADAEVFVTTANYLGRLAARCWLHVPLPAGADIGAVASLAGMTVIRARAPIRLPALRHLCCGLSLVFCRAFRQADLVYTRNLWVAWVAMLFGQRVAFDHYRPWPDQIPPLQLWIHRLMCGRKFVVNICHSDYTRRKYLDLGVPESKLVCIRNGFEPARLDAFLPRVAAKTSIGVPAGRKTVVYTGRLNHKKGLHLAIEAARRLPDLLFLFVGSYGDGPIEKLSSTVANIRIVPWQPPHALARYLFAADVLLIPPSWTPLATFGSTVLPLKLFFYMASGRPILAGDTPDVAEVLRDRENAFLCKPDSADALVAGLRELTEDGELSERLSAKALRDSRGLTWSARAASIFDLLAERLPAARVPRAGWSRAHYRTWLDRSRQWLVHLIRNGSWVLPPC